MKMQFILGDEGRKGLVRAVSNILGTETRYMGAPGFCYDVSGCIIDRDGGIDIPDDVDARSLADKLRDLGYERKDKDMRCSIVVSADDFDDRSMQNLNDLIKAKAPLIQKALNADSLAVKKEDNTLIFDWFATVPTPDELGVYTQFLSALVKMAKEQQRITAKPTEVENEKYAFRCFLLRLRFIGKEFADARKLLLSRLSGNTAFKRTNHEGDI